MANSNRNFVNVNINPCKMCMPMGAAIAFKGIENGMFMLHGSQGCSTYIRRHMAGHYNEPVDIASSSLNEKGTVYGGESNLKKGLDNMVKLYNPQVIGVATTCLAETIGEDIGRILSEVAETGDFEGVSLIPVSTPGYGGSEFEGYYSALCSIVKTIVKETFPNGKVNVIAGMLNPGDIRNIKSLLNAFGIDYILLPDISNTLDAPYSTKYRRIPEGGTKIPDIEKMAGAAATIEIGLTIPESLSPGKYLLEKFNIPLYRCSLPIGIENTDVLINILAQISGKPIPTGLKEERGRYIDGMIDSHKYNAEGRAVIYGNPELVAAVSRLCMENGITPVLICTGTQNSEVKTLLKNWFKDSEPLFLDDIDFETIRKHAVQLKANILLGNSDGKYITEKEGIPLVRIGFPIHDRMGGQRLISTAYNGSQTLLDNITNILLENKHSTYRKSLFDRYYKPDENADKTNVLKIEDIKLKEKTAEHPCYSAGACENARMHIPVAPACNISCNYCNRKYDCVNESRPGVTSEVLTPEQAAAKFSAVRSKVKNLKVVGIAGPGDALANFENTKRSIELIKEIDPDITFCLSTNGLMLPYYADELISLGIRHVTITINAIDPGIAEKIYREVDFKGMKLTGRGAAELLIMNQLAGLKFLASKGVVCKVNTVMIKGINDGHIEAVVKKVKECGAYITNIMPLIPAKGSAFENMQLTNNKELNEVRKKCGVHIKQMLHCKQCRADAIGKLSEDISAEFMGCTGCSSKNEEEENGEVYLFAAASSNGKYIDRHFGQVEEFYIFRHDNKGVRFIEKRTVGKYCSGSEDCGNEESKISKIVNTISDCNGVLVLRIGYEPSKVLKDKGIEIFQTCGSIEAAINNSVEKLKVDTRVAAY